MYATEKRLQDNYLLIFEKPETRDKIFEKPETRETRNSRKQKIEDTLSIWWGDASGQGARKPDSV